MERQEAAAWIELSGRRPTRREPDLAVNRQLVHNTPSMRELPSTAGAAGERGLARR